MTIKGSYSGRFLTVLSEWVDDMREDVQSSIRPAAQAGSQVLYEAVLANVPRSLHAHWFYGTHQKYFYRAGTLRSSIYQVFSKGNSTDKKSVYHISWNYNKCPYGFMVEYGTVRANPVGFIRNATSRMPQALEVAEKKFFEQLKHFK